MRKIWKIPVCVVLAVCLMFAGSVLQDRMALSQKIIRLHVVAASDELADQELKLRIRDAVMDYLSDGIARFTDVQQAKRYLQSELENLKALAMGVIHSSGFAYDVRVTLDEEAFETRYYDTFTLPAGVYDSLRIVIGPGQGSNWWCVVFPGLCLPKSTQDMQTSAAGAGFSDTLTGSISQEEGYTVRFWILDCLGRIQNFFFMG